jgi:hypothetical protein
LIVRALALEGPGLPFVARRGLSFSVAVGSLWRRSFPDTSPPVTSSRTQRAIGIGVGVGVVLAALAIGGSLGGESTTPPEPLTLGEPGTPLGGPPLVDGEPAETFVPDLPAVPTLPEGTHLSRSHGDDATDDDRSDDLSAEMRLVSEARRTMLEDPAAAIALLDQHRERYPAGALGEERDAYTILALDALARTADVERRYVDFRADYPASTFLPAIERALATP